MIALWLSLAVAGELAWKDMPVDRVYKVESYAYDPMPGNRWMGDWQEIDMQYFSGLLSCKRIEPGVDRCVFENGVLHFGYRLKDQEEIHDFTVPVPGVAELHWQAHGRIRGDFEGNPTPFHEGITEAHRHQFHKPDKWTWTPDLARTVGDILADFLFLEMTGPLAFELPPDPSTPEWRTKPPMVVQTFIGEPLASDTRAQVVGQAGSRRMLRMEGDFREGRGGIGGTVKIDAMFDTSRGYLTESRSEVAFDRNYVGWFNRRLVLARIAITSDTPAAGEIDPDALKR